jgi:hypothetical protein
MFCIKYILAKSSAMSILPLFSYSRPYLFKDLAFTQVYCVPPSRRHLPSVLLHRPISSIQLAILNPCALSTTISSFKTSFLTATFLHSILKPTQNSTNSTGNRTEPRSRSIAEADQAASSSSSTPTGTNPALTTKTTKPSGARRAEGLSSGMALLLALTFCLIL